MARIVLAHRSSSKTPAATSFAQCCCWASGRPVIFVFFSLFSSKLPGYIVPVFPALALLAAIGLNSLDPAHWRRLVLVPVALVAVGLLALPIHARLGESTT